MVPIVASPSASELTQCKHASRTAIMPTRTWSSGSNMLTISQRQLPAVKITFLQAFGLLGVPMFLIALGCVLWTVWLICLAVAPNATANYLMNTAEFDDGTFWLIIDPDKALMVVTVTGLSLVVLGYVYVLAKMTLLRNRVGKYSRIEATASRIQSKLQSMPLPRPKWRQWVRNHWFEMTNFHGHRRKYWNLFHMAVDLLIQSLTLHQMLERGNPPVLIYGYAVLIAGNAGVYAVCVLLPTVFSAFVEMLIGSVFDLMVAVGFPIIMLAYCYSHFELDRNAILLNMEIFPKGNIQQGARMYANPAQIALFRAVFDKLRVISASDLFLSLGMDMSFCYRFIRVVAIMVQSHREAIALRASDRTSSKTRFATVVGQRAVSRIIALLALAFSALLLTATHGAITLSTKLCQPHAECVVFAFQWARAPRDSNCPCITLIDRHTTPKTYEEWISPIDVTDKVRQLAAAGSLRVIDIINRRLSSWPDELQRCTNMQYISLFYTDIDYVPKWLRSFKRLEFLHIEGKASSTNLVTLPNDLFVDMHALTFLHLGVHFMLTELPSFQGLTNVQVMVLAVLVSIQELPSFASLKQLRRLQLVGLTSLLSIPDLTPCSHIVQLSITGRGSMCCNGFLRTSCDPSHPYCRADIYVPAAPCLNATTSSLLASDATLSYMHKFASSVCQVVSADSADSELIVESQVDFCDGVVFRQCPANAAGTPGICTNLRMQVLMCFHDPYTIAMRQQQILRGIGTRCDPVEEAWLGCKA